MTDLIDLADYPLRAAALRFLCHPICWAEQRAAIRRWHEVTQPIAADRRFEFLTATNGRPRAVGPNPRTDSDRFALDYHNKILCSHDRKFARAEIDRAARKVEWSVLNRVQAGEIEVVAQSRKVGSPWFHLSPDRFVAPPGPLQRADFTITNGKGVDIDKDEYGIRMRDVTGVSFDQAVLAYADPDDAASIMKLELIGAPDLVGMAGVDREIDFEGAKTWFFRDAPERYRALRSRLATSLVERLAAGEMVATAGGSLVPALEWQHEIGDLRGGVSIRTPASARLDQADPGSSSEIWDRAGRSGPHRVDYSRDQAAIELIIKDEGVTEIAARNRIKPEYAKRHGQTEATWDSKFRAWRRHLREMR